MKESKMKFDNLKQFAEASLINCAKWLREASLEDVATVMGFDEEFAVAVFKSVGKQGIIDLVQSTTGNFEEALARLLSIEFEPHKQQPVDDFSVIQDKFSELAELFQDICIPYLITSVDEKGHQKLIESEIIEVNEKYEQFKIKINQFIEIIQVFFMKSNFVLSDNCKKFTNHIDTDLYEAVKIFESINKDNQLQIEKIKKSYSAFIILARLINTSIKMYNDFNPNNKLDQLHNIPNHQFYEVTDINQFITEFTFDLKKIINDME
jgi:hypothetical protein